MLGRLHAAHAIVMEQGESTREEIRLRHEIRVENGDEFARPSSFAQERERAVHVASLGVGVVGACDVADAASAAELFQFSRLPSSRTKTRKLS